MTQLLPFQVQGQGLGDPTLVHGAPCSGVLTAGRLTPKPPAKGPSGLGSLGGGPGDGSRARGAPGSPSRRRKWKARPSARENRASARRRRPVATGSTSGAFHSHRPRRGDPISPPAGQVPRGRQLSAASACAPGARSSQGSGQHQGDTPCPEAGILREIRHAGSTCRPSFQHD